MITITLKDEGFPRYTMSYNTNILGRMYDNNSEKITVVKPDVETDSVCTMIVTTGNAIKKTLDQIEVEDNPIDIGGILSEYEYVNIGFSFSKPNGYVKNSEYKEFKFLKALKPDNWIPSEPIIRRKFDALFNNGFVEVQYQEGSEDTLEFKNVFGDVVDTIRIISGRGTTNYNDLENKPKINNVTLVGNKTSEDLGLASDADVQGLEQRVTGIENEVADALDNISSINTSINKNVVSGIGISANVDNVSINSNIVNIKTGTTSTDTDAIPLANDTTAGLMSHSDYAQIRQNTEDIASLKGQTIRIAYSTKTNPTAQEIQQFVTDAGYTQDQWPQIAVVVTGTNYVWRYYANDGWTQQTDVVSIFTNDTAGIIKGSTANGKIYAETDGTGSVNGFDNLTNNITAILSAYLKNATVSNNTLTITKQDNTTVEFPGGSVEVDNVTINKNAQGQLEVKNGGITNAKLNSALKATSIGDTPSNDKLTTESAIYNYIASGNNGKTRALDAVDLNTVTVTGLYSCNVCTNRPTENNGVMLVLKNAFTSDNLVQVYWTFVADVMWIRHKDLGTWKSWVKVLKNGDISVSATGTATDEVGYITINGVEKKLVSGGDVEVDNTTISKNSDNELQAIGLTDGTDSLTFAQIYQAMTIRRHT